jgi:flagellar basal body-associated protein FliL
VVTLKTGAVIIVRPNLKGGLKMNRYILVYTFLAIVMAALVYIIGMPWVSSRRKFARYEEQQKQRQKERHKEWPRS